MAERGIDVLDCPRCHARMGIVAMIEDPETARKILEHLGLPARAAPRGVPWRPAQQHLADAAARSTCDGDDPPAFVE